jgi:death on curing protein
LARREPDWIGLDLVLAIHDEQLAEHGGAVGVRDLGLLQSALARPRNRQAYSRASLATLAASYGRGIVSNHPFLDGNKRTSLVVAELFLILNGQLLVATDEVLAMTWLKLAAGSLSEKQLASWIATRLEPAG